MKVILGSQSIYRKKILEEMGIDFDVLASDIDEKAIRFEDPRELVAALARAKADALLPKISEPAILITSDEVVVCEGNILEKPEDEEEARLFLKRYNVSPAQTVTAVAVTDTSTGKCLCEVDVTQVYFRPFSEEEIADIIADEEVFHLSGGFSIEGEKWHSHVERIEGTIDSIAGLPKEITRRLLDAILE